MKPMNLIALVVAMTFSMANSVPAVDATNYSGKYVAERSKNSQNDCSVGRHVNDKQVHTS